MQRNHWFNGIVVNVGQENVIDFVVQASLNRIINVWQEYVKIKVRMGVYPHLFFCKHKYAVATYFD